MRERGSECDALCSQPEAVRARCVREKLRVRSRGPLLREAVRALSACVGGRVRSFGPLWSQEGWALGKAGKEGSRRAATESCVPCGVVILQSRDAP